MLSPQILFGARKCTWLFCQVFRSVSQYSYGVGGLVTRTGAAFPIGDDLSPESVLLVLETRDILDKASDEE